MDGGTRSVGGRSARGRQHAGDSPPPPPGQLGSAWAVHGFTALGIVAAMLALRDMLVDRPSYAIIWLLLTLLIDGVDGPIARALRGRDACRASTGSCST